MLFSALTLCGAAAALALTPSAGRRAPPRGLLLAVPSAGAAFHVAGLTQLPSVGLAFALSLLAFFIVCLQVVSERLLRVSAVALFTAPLAAGLVGLALLLGLAPGAQPAAGRHGRRVPPGALSGLRRGLPALAVIAGAPY